MRAVTRSIALSLALMAAAGYSLGCGKARVEGARQLEFAGMVMQDVLPGLVKALQEKVKADGAAKAVPFCNEFAPQYGKSKISEWSTKAGTELRASSFRFRRVSAQPRNPKNAPTPRQLQTLEGWAKNGAEATYFVDAGKHYTMHPIKISQPLCLSCHGAAETADKAALAAVRKLYPDDKATGYKLGDLRGAFVTEAEFAGE